MKALGTTRSKLLLLMLGVMLGTILVTCSLSKLNGFLVLNDDNNTSDDIELIKSYLEAHIWISEESYCEDTGITNAAFHIIFDYPKVYAIPVKALDAVIRDGLGSPENPTEVPSTNDLARIHAGTGLDLGDTCKKTEEERIQDILIMKKYISITKPADLIIYLKTFGTGSYKEVAITESNYGLDLAINKDRPNLKYLYMIDPSQINNHAEFYYLPFSNSLIYTTTKDSYLYNKGVALTQNTFFTIYK